MDEYKEYLYKRRPHYRNIDTGDISKQKELREKLHCKSFRWFMENVAFDLPKKYPPIEPPDFAQGEVCYRAQLLCFCLCLFVYLFVFFFNLKMLAIICLLFLVSLQTYLFCLSLTH
jgi:hypothetical protein